MSRSDDVGRAGVGYGLAAYALWGAVPLFWPLVARAGAVEALAHRIVWSLVISAVVALVVLPKGWLRAFATPRTVLLLGLAAALIAVNWGTFIWAVNHGHVVETALGYYINPIFSILVGVFVLGERLAALQWVSVGLAGVAVVVLTVDYGRPPWISLVLACSFAAYGLIKKRVNGGAVQTLTIESAVLTPLALVYLVVLQLRGDSTFLAFGWPHSLFLVATGVVTVIPLLLFAAATTRLPLSTLGLLQYLAPTIAFLLGVFHFGEQMPVGRWVGFGLVWVALMLLTGYGLRRAGASRRAGRIVTEPI